MDFAASMELDHFAVERTERNISDHHSNNSKTPMVRRTQSYDAADCSGLELGEGDFIDFANSQYPLHTSFDICQLTAYRLQDEDGGSLNDMCPPPSTHHNIAAVSTGSNSSAAALSTLSSTAKTPMRMRFSRPGGSSINRSNKASGKQTPASAKRHNRSFARRLSPGAHHRSPSLFRATPDATTGVFAASSAVQQQPIVPRSLSQPGAAYFSRFEGQNQPNEESSEQSQCYRMDPPLPLCLEPAATPAHKKPPKRSIGTVATVANSTILETTTETDGSSENSKNNSNKNIDLAGTQSFHFSAFPASLPRIPPNTGQNPAARSVLLPPAFDEDSNTSGHSSTFWGNMDQHGQVEPHFSDMEDDMSTSPISTPVGRRRLNFNSALTPTGQVLPGTPKDVKMHFGQGGQCSPIRGIPEEEGDLTRSTITEKNSSVLDQSVADSSNGSSRGGGSRPMPDMQAFEGDISHDGSTSEKGSSSSRSHQQSPKLLCPPTPVRTPAWVHAPGDGSSNHLQFHLPASIKKVPLHKYGRQNSLITTKVLATCSQRDLDGRTSLENSLFEDDSTRNLHQSNDASGNASSILTMGAATEPETDHTSTDKDPHDKLDGCDNEDTWLHGHRRSIQVFDEDPEMEHETLNSGDEQVVSMSTTFEILGMLGRGTFADVFKVRSKKDGKLYAVKKHRRQFRGRRDREMTLAEVRHMQRLQRTNNHGAKSSYCLYLLFFYQAWQEDGHFFCQTELCCRDTCREFMDSLRLNWVISRTRYPCLRRLPPPLGIAANTDQDIIGRLVPEPTIWKICHDIGAGLSHIHSHGLAHNDIKPSNIFFVAHPHLGAMCKIGDFGMAGDIGTSEDGQEGDAKYMAPELLSSGVKHPSADMFSLGLTLYELASSLGFEVPAEGQLWHDLRSSRNNMAEIPKSRDPELIQLIQLLVSPSHNARPSADAILSRAKVQRAGAAKEEFLMAYIRDVEEDERRGQERSDGQTPRILGRPRMCVSPNLSIPVAPRIFSSPKQMHPTSRA